MDGHRFDLLTRSVGAETTRRGALRAAAGGALALLGLQTLNEEALAEKGFDGDRCKKNKNCGAGLFCKGGKKKRKNNKGRCRYQDGCGKKGDYCKNNSDCCGTRKCRNDRCRGQN